MARKRVALTIDEDIFQKFQENIVSAGFPKSAVSVFVQQFMASLNDDVVEYGTSSQLELFNYKSGSLVPVDWKDG